MHEEFREGFQQRFPGKKNIRVPRKTLTAIGPFHEVSGDGHEKMAQLGLRMGEIGLPMYGFKDKWTDRILYFKLLPDCRTAGALDHFFLDMVTLTECMCFKR